MLHLHPRYWKCGAHLQESEGVLQLEKRINQGIRLMYLSVRQPVFFNRWRCLITKAFSSFCDCICSCLHMRWSLYKLLSLKINALVKRIMQIKAAYFQSSFHQCYFVCCSRRHLTEKAGRVK